MTADELERLPSPEDALTRSALTGEAVRARDGRSYSHKEIQRRFVEGRVDGFCDFAASIVATAADPEFLELCRQPPIRDRVRGHCERLAEEAWKLANRLESR